MWGSNPNSRSAAHGLRAASLRWWRPFVVCLALILGSVFAAAQKPPASPPPPPVASPSVVHPRPPAQPADGDVRVNLNNLPTSRDAEKPDTCFLPPLDSIRTSIVAVAQLQIPAKARREYQRACSALSKKRSSDAEKHLRKSVQEYARYAVAWVTLGQVLADEHRFEDATNACGKAATVDPISLHAQLCLAAIASSTQAWSEELKHSSRALELDPGSVLAYEYHAAANANLGDLGKAERSGLRAIALDPDHHVPSVFFLLAQIYELKGDTAREQEQFRQFLKYTHNHERAAMAKRILSELENEPREELVVSESKKSREASETSAQEWHSDGIEETAAPVVEDATCPLPQILQDTSDRATQLVETLQSFTATEQIEHTELRKNGKIFKSNSELFSYLAEIKQNPDQSFWVDEYRTQEKGEADPPPLTDLGTAGLALMFHPKLIGNLQIHCEGRTDLHATSTWQLRFEEGADPRKSFSAMVTKDSIYRTRLKGRAWISADNYQVLRIETDLAEPVPKIRLEVYHFDVAYSPVEFAKCQCRLWLPEQASVHLELQGHRYQRVHKFSHFQLFLVDTAQRVTEPTATGIGGLEILTDTQGVDFAPYLQRVVRKIKQNWYAVIPERAQPPLLKRGKVVIEFAIEKDGQIARLRSARTSGDEALDGAAYGGIKASNPFLPLPAEFPGQYLGLRFIFFYNPLLTAITPPGPQVRAGTSLQFSPVLKGITNPTDSQITWSVGGRLCAGSACGTISDSGLYTAPLQIPGDPTVTVEATAAGDLGETASVVVTILPPEKGISNPRVAGSIPAAPTSSK